MVTCVPRPVATWGTSLRSRSSCPRHQRECHLYFARPVTFISCADIDALVLRATGIRR